MKNIKITYFYHNPKLNKLNLNNLKNLKKYKRLIITLTLIELSIDMILINKLLQNINTPQTTQTIEAFTHTSKIGGI